MTVKYLNSTAAHNASFFEGAACVRETTRQWPRLFDFLVEWPVIRAKKVHQLSVCSRLTNPSGGPKQCQEIEA